MTNKPSWSDAPEWANWLAKDKNGSWFWYEEAPYQGIESWRCSGKIVLAEPSNDDWQSTLEPRP